MRGVTAGPWLGCLLFGAALAAQQTPAAAPRGQRLDGAVVDSVVATVNDSGILMSQARTLAAPRLRALKAQGRISREDEQFVIERAIDGEVDRYRMALAAKSFAGGSLPPEQIDRYVDMSFERDRDEQIRELGSLTAFSDELKRIGRTWAAEQRDRRMEALFDIAQELTVRKKLAGQSRAFLTPKMLRQEYDDNRSLFVAPAAATIVHLRFSGPDAEKHALAAAEFWRDAALDIDLRDLAARYPGATAVRTEIDAEKLAAELAPLSAFALAGPRGAVSAPVPVRGGFVVARVNQHQPARNDDFRDPKVQQQLRELCTDKLVAELREQANAMARQRTETWISK